MKKEMTLVFLFATVVVAYSQRIPPPGLPRVPIDSNVAILLGIGIAYGIKKIFDYTRK